MVNYLLSTMSAPPQICSHFSPTAKIVLFHGDARDLLSQIPDASVGLIITSPPYNLGKRYEIRAPLTTYLDNNTEVISECIRVLANDGSLCWQVGNYIERGEVYPLDIHYYSIFKDAGLKLRNRIIWHFGHGLHASKR